MGMRGLRYLHLLVGILIALCAVAAFVAMPAVADVCNLGFEDGVVSPWVTFNSVGTTTASIQEAPRTGTYAVRLSQLTAGNKGGVYQRFPVTAGQQYTITAYCVSSSSNNAARMRVDAAGGTSYTTFTIEDNQAVIASYTLMSCGNVTASSNYITVFLAQESLANTERYAHYDDVSVTPVAPTTASASPTSISAGQSCSFSVTGAYGTRVGWYSDAACTSFVGEGNPFNLTSIIATTTLYARNEITCAGTVTGYSTTPSAKSATVTVSGGCTPPNAPTSPTANPSTINLGGSSMLSASVGVGEIVDWYTGSCGGTLIGSGASLVVSPTVTTTYYPRARIISTGCGSVSCGTAVTVTVSCTAPNAPTSPTANPSTINSGGSSTLSASVGVGEIVDWYTGSCGGTLIGSGVSLIVSPTSATTYYPRARNISTGCNSVSCGTAVSITVTSSNSLLNAGFESWSGTQSANSWTQYNASVTCSKGSTFSGTPSVAAYNGSECQRVMLDAAYEEGGVYQRFSSVSGNHYTVSVWMLTRKLLTNAEARLGVDPSGATSPGANTAWSTRVTGDSEWTQKTMTVTATGPYITVFLNGKHKLTDTTQCSVFFDEATAYVTSNPPSAKNIILMIGDGMGFEHVKAGSYYLTGQTGKVSFEPYYKCSVGTLAVNDTGAPIITDSAAAATAMATGHKTKKMYVGLGQYGTEYQTLLEYAKSIGKRVGWVTNDVITGATPAGFAAHDFNRFNYLGIGDDYLTGSQPELMFGGGDPATGDGSYFSSAQVSQAVSQGYTTVNSYASMNNLNPTTVSKALGLFKGNRLTYEVDRIGSNTEPHLSQMAAKALAIMEQDPDGFFLLIEGDNIDEVAHNNNINYTTKEVVELHNTSEVVMNWLSTRNDTLLIVTADHETGGLTTGWGSQGNTPSATWSATGHTAANVPLYTLGAGSSLLSQFISSGVIDNTEIFSFMHKVYENAPSQPPILPTAPTSASASAATICSGASSTLTATGGSGTTLRWLTGSCIGTSVGVSNDLVVSPTSTTTYYARWETSDGNSTCATTTVTVNPIPVTPTAPTSNSRCGTGNVAFGVTPAASCTVKWYAASTSGSSISAANPYSPSISATTTYYAASVSAAGCESATRTACTGTVNAVPAVPTSPLATPSLIKSPASSTLSATFGSGGNTVEWFSGSCGGTSVTSPVSPGSTTTYYARTKNSTTSCVSATCASVTVTVDNAAPVATFTATENSVNVKTGAMGATTPVTIQGNVVITVTASDSPAGLLDTNPVSVTVAGVTTGPVTGSAGVYSCTATVNALTANGAHAITVTATDKAGNVTTSTDWIFVNKNRITGTVSMGLTNTTITRVVTFVLNGGATVTASVNSGGAYTLTNVPGSTTNISAKTAWTLRKNVTGINMALNDGQATATFTLLGGDLNGTNSININDYSILKANWFTSNAVADINGSGIVNGDDYNIMKLNWFKLGD